MMSNKSKFKQVMNKRAIFVSLLWAILIVYNICSQKGEFFKIPIYQVLSLMVAVGVAYYLVQKKNDTRKQKEIIEKSISKIQVLLIELIDEKNRECAIALNLNRQINNKINVLMEYNIEQNEEISYIKEQFSDIRSYIGDNITALDTLDWKHIKVKVNNIESKCDKIVMNLYFGEVS